MCNPVAVAVVMMVAMAAKTYVDQKKQADLMAKQKEAMKDRADFIEKQAKIARQIDLDTLEEREEEIESKGALESFERVRQANREAAKLKLSSAESNVFGTSIFRQLATSEIQEMHDLGIIHGNMENELQQNELMGQKVEADFASRMEDARLTKKGSKLYNAAPSWMNWTGVGLAGLQGFASGYSMGSGMASTPNTNSGYATSSNPTGTR